MSNVELVIKISEDQYDIIKSDLYNTFPAEMKEWGLEAIRNGIPLQKGHGKLKDFDKIEWYGCDFEGKACEKANGDCSVCNFGNCDAKQIRDLPTIVEAESEE